MTVVSVLPLAPVHTDRHQVGDIRFHDDRFWRVGMVSELRMRLDPASGSLHSINGSVFTDYGKCINVSPNALLEIYDARIHGDLDPQVQARVERMEKQQAKERRMAKAPVAAAAVKGNANGTAPAPVNAALPPGVPKGKSSAEAERRARLERRNDERRALVAAVVPDGVVKPPKAPREPKPPAAKRQCTCGCPEMVPGFFAQGHDARFKGWMIKVERGELDIVELPRHVQTKFKFVKKGEGFVTTHNYKGEPHSGYDKGVTVGAPRKITVPAASPVAAQPGSGKKK